MKQEDVKNLEQELNDDELEGAAGGHEQAWRGEEKP